MRGFNLIELVVVIAITSTLSLFLYESIIHFQYQSQVETATYELVSTLRDAQSRSRSGAILPGETADTFTSDGLPVYGITINGHSYVLIRNAIYKTPVPPPAPESHIIDSSITVTSIPPNMTVMFRRITGLPDTTATIMLQKGTTTSLRTIIIKENGLITVL